MHVWHPFQHVRRFHGEDQYGMPEPGREACSENHRLTASFPILTYQAVNDTDCLFHSWWTEEDFNEQ